MVKMRITTETYINANFANVIKAPTPQFVWNVDEQKILSYPNTFEVYNNGTTMNLQIKPGNRMIYIRTYSDIESLKNLAPKAYTHCLVYESEGMPRCAFVNENGQID